MGVHEISGSPDGLTKCSTTGSPPSSSLTDLTEKKTAHATTTEVDADEAVFEHLENEL